MNKTTTLALIVLGILAGAIIAYAVTTYLNIPTTGNIQTLPFIETDTPSINWGSFTLGQGETASIIITLTNTGDQPTTPLTMTAIWQTPTTPLGAVTWNGTDIIINGHQSKHFTIDFTYTDTTYVGPFEFAISIGDNA